MGGFTDRDWGDRRYAPYHRPSGGTPPTPGHVFVSTDREIWTGTIALTAAQMFEPTAVDRARETLVRQLDRHCEERGLLTVEVHWSARTETAAPGDPQQVLLEADLRPRRDGIWGSIRAAMDEDAADRLLAAQEAVQGLLPPD